MLERVLVGARRGNWMGVLYLRMLTGIAGAVLFGTRLNAWFLEVFFSWQRVGLLWMDNWRNKGSSPIGTVIFSFLPTTNNQQVQGYPFYSHTSYHNPSFAACQGPNILDRLMDENLVFRASLVLTAVVGRKRETLHTM